MTTPRDAYPVPGDESPSAWIDCPVTLPALDVTADEIDKMRPGVLEYVGLETFGMMPDDMLDENGESMEDHLTLGFVKDIMIDRARLSLWSVKDDQDVWADAYVVYASWDRPPLRTKGSIISISDAEGLSPDQFLWRFFHLSVVESLN